VADLDTHVRMPQYLIARDSTEGRKMVIEFPPIPPSPLDEVDAEMAATEARLENQLKDVREIRENLRKMRAERGV
jgi:hypothetical protein